MTSIRQMREHLNSWNVHTFGVRDVEIEKKYTLAVSPAQAGDIVSNRGGYLYKVDAVHDDGTADVHRLATENIERLDLNLFWVHTRPEVDA